MVLEMPVIPPKQASFTLLVGIPYSRARHLNDTKVYTLTNVPTILLCPDSKTNALGSFYYVLIVLGLSLTFSSEKPLYKGGNVMWGC